MNTIKIAILEKDGEEYHITTEIDLLSALKHIAFNNFPVKNIIAGTKVIIPEDQQMMLSQYINVSGELDIQGELVIL